MCEQEHKGRAELCRRFSLWGPNGSSLHLALQLVLVWRVVISHQGCWASLFCDPPELGRSILCSWVDWVPKHGLRTQTHHPQKYYCRLLGILLELLFRTFRQISDYIWIYLSLLSCWGGCATWLLMLLQPYHAMLLPVVHLIWNFFPTICLGQIPF